MDHLNSIAYRLWFGIIAGMGKEALEQSPITPLEELVHRTEEQWEQNWQDSKFTAPFPKTAASIVSSEEWSILTDEDRKLMVGRATKTFMRLSWKSAEQGSIASNTLLVNKDLDSIGGYKKTQVVGLESRGENLIRCNIGAFILLGKSLNDKEWINNIVSESYQQLNSNKKTNFRQHILRLTTKDNFFRNWVKTNNLDSQNGFEWNREMAKIFLQLVASDSVNKFPVAFSEDLKIYPIEVVDEFLNYALGCVKEPSQIVKKRRRNPMGPEFIMQLDNLRNSGHFDESPLALQVQQKIEDLRSVVQNPTH